jgi:arylsulfatase A-like enzyme
MGTPPRAIVAILAFALLLAPPARAQTRPPNVVFILADDLGYGDLGCYGQKVIQTPAVDRLAAEGMRFTDCYAGSTVCAPSRCALMTGKHTGHTSIRGNSANATIRAGELTVPAVFKSRGYATTLIGKWGCGEVDAPGDPLKVGFDSYFGYLNQTHAHNYYPTWLWRNDQKVPLRNVVPDEKPTGAGVATTRVDYSADLCADEAIKFLDERRQHPGQPFFLYLPFTLPHANNEGKQHGMEVPDDGPYAAHADWPEEDRHRAAMITRLDSYVARVMAKLKELNLDDDTIVFFTSDNGPHREGGSNPEYFHSSGPLRGIKRDLYEGGIRIPMIVRWPGHVAPAKTSAEPWAFWDLLPTAADLAGAPAPKGIDGVDVLPTLLGSADQHLADRFFYWEFHEGKFDSQAVRWRNWKALRPAKGAAWELYDLTADVGEQHNVAAKHPDVMKRVEEYVATARSEPQKD